MNIISLVYVAQRIKVYAVSSISSLSYIKQITKLAYERVVNKVTFSKETTALLYQNTFIGDSYPLESFIDDITLTDSNTVLSGGRINGGYCTSWVAKRINE